MSGRVGTRLSLSGGTIAGMRITTQGTSAAVLHRHAPAYADRFGERIGERWPSAPPPSDQPIIVNRSGPVIAARQASVIALGSLADRHVIDAQRLVTAYDVDGLAWWVAAESVWEDAANVPQPEHIRPIGLATTQSRAGTLMAGLSDRLGWEATQALASGMQLPVADVDYQLAQDAVVLDGRLEHDVPTVVVTAPGVMRWGAGASWESALHRALYGSDGSLDDEAELIVVAKVLHEQGLDIGEVEVSTALLRKAGIVRSSVQLLSHS